jgi:hypothetical protein
VDLRQTGKVVTTPRQYNGSIILNVALIGDTTIRRMNEKLDLNGLKAT